MIHPSLTPIHISLKIARTIKEEVFDLILIVNNRVCLRVMYFDQPATKFLDYNNIER